MGMMINSSNDVVTFLKSQHQQVKRMFQSVMQARGEARAKAFFALRRMLAVHETAEEEIIHPVARRELANGNAIVNARLREENEAKTLLSQLEDMNLNSAEFEAKFSNLEEVVLSHAEAEEREEFERIGAKLDSERLERMKKAVEIAEAIAPTRPHPGFESAAANMIAGPFVSMVDRTRDALTGKS